MARKTIKITTDNELHEEIKHAKAELEVQNNEEFILRLLNRAELDRIQLDVVENKLRKYNR